MGNVITYNGNRIGDVAKQRWRVMAKLLGILIDYVNSAVNDNRPSGTVVNVTVDIEGTVLENYRHQMLRHHRKASLNLTRSSPINRKDWMKSFFSTSMNCTVCTLGATFCRNMTVRLYSLNPSSGL